MGRSAKLISGLAVSMRGTNKWKQARMQRRAGSARVKALQLPRLPYGIQEAVQRLSCRAVVICQNFSNDRREVIHASTRHDDAVAAAVSFLGDAQESPAVVLAELHVEVLALNLQFFRLDDVIHFSLRPPTLPSQLVEWKKNLRFLCTIFSAHRSALTFATDCPWAEGNEYQSIGRC